MKDTTGILIENEKQANRIVARVMRITFAVFTFIYILNVVGIFIIDVTVMTVSYIGGSTLLLLPSFFVDILKLEKRYIKHINVNCAILFVMLITVTLTYHVVVVYVYPIAIASLYFSKKLNVYATAMTVVVVSVGQLLAFFAETVPDENFFELYRLIVYGMIPRGLSLIAVAAIFTMLCSRTTSLLSNLLRAKEELSLYHDEMIMGFATLVENKDGSTGGHVKRTTAYVRLLAEELQKRGFYREVLTEEYVDNLCKAAPMHDIGKISAPDIILQKPAELTLEEYEKMKEHADSGGRIIQETFGHLSNKEYTQMAYEVARFHHEKWDGTGYPEGRKKEEIPLCARIMAVADVFDAVSEDRCYRDALTLEKCFEIIAEGSGQDFEPLLVEVFLDIRDKVEQVHNRTMTE